MSVFDFLRPKQPVADVAERIEPVVAEPVVAAAATPPVPFQQVHWPASSTGSRVKTLPPVSPVIAQKHATVYTCCNVISGDLAKVPLEIWQRDSEGKESRVREHDAVYLLNVESSPKVAAITMRFALNYAYTLRGTAYGYSPRDGGGALTLIEAIDVDGVSVLRAGRERFYAFTDGAEVQRRVPSRVMAHLRYNALDGWTGRSPIQVAAESIGLALAGQEAAARSASGRHVSAYISMEGVYDTGEDEARNARRLRAALDDPEANGLPIVGANDKITPLSLTAADQQLLESRKFDREQIIGLYRVPPSKAQMLENGVKANGQQQAIDYKSDCLLHWGGFIEGQMGLGLLTEAERRAGLFLRHDFDALMQATTKERYDALGKAVGGPFMTPNEGRRKDGLPDIPGGDDLNPAPNMTRTEKPKKDADE